MEAASPHGAWFMPDEDAELGFDRDYEQLARSLGLATLPSATNFVAIDVGSQTRAQALLGALQERGVFVRMPRAPPLDRCVRVTIAPVADRVEFARIFETLFSE